MEAFVATNESQWEVIQKVIDECDYYVLILGGRYGTVTSEGISYTEKEYNYAKSLDIPVLAFIHASPGTISNDKSEKEPGLKEKLEAFRKRVMDEYPVKQWTSATELGGHVSRALVRAFRVYPRPGWRRSSGESDLELLKQVNDLRVENGFLKEKLAAKSQSAISIPDLETGDDYYTIKGGARHLKNEKSVTIKWEAEATWDDIFREIGPKLQNEASEDEIKKSLARFIGWASYKEKSLKRTFNTVRPESFEDIIVQFRALGLIERGKRKRPISDKSGYWCLTEDGDKYLVALVAKKKSKSPKTLPSESDDDVTSTV